MIKAGESITNFEHIYNHQHHYTLDLFIFLNRVRTKKKFNQGY
jgi:hypothetical protein